MHVTLYNTPCSTCMSLKKCRIISGADRRVEGVKLVEQQGHSTFAVAFTQPSLQNLQNDGGWTWLSSFSTSIAKYSFSSSL